MRLSAYGPGRDKPRSLSSTDPRVRDNQQLLNGWGRRALALKAPERIIGAEEAARVDDSRESPGASAGAA